MEQARRDTAGTAALEIEDLCIELAGDLHPTPLVQEVTLQVAPGELVALLGESGSGKSLTARAIMGLLPRSMRCRAGRLHVGGQELLSLDERQLRGVRGERVSLIMQDALSALNPVLSIGDQLGELFRVHRGASRRQARERATDLLALVGIPSPAARIKDYPHQISGGMRQRILIAMAVALDPELLIADEPTTALDVTVQAQILDLLDGLRERLGTAVLLITHDLGVVMEVADRVAVMYAGRIVETGSATELLERPAHPYTEALLRSVPELAPPGQPLPAIVGTPPSPDRLPSGCAFHPRCAHRLERCRTQVPAIEELSPGRGSACFLARRLHDDHA